MRTTRSPPGSWAARRYPGLGSLTPGAPADAVVYDADPRTDLTQRVGQGPPASAGQAERLLEADGI